MGARTWAAIGNVLKLSAIVGYLVGGFLGYQAIQLNQRAAPSSVVFEAAAGTALIFGIAIVLWNLKGPLVSGNVIARVLVGVYMLGWIVSTAGVGLIVIGIVYVFTGEPSASETTRSGKQQKRRFSSGKWHATGRVGPSGATLYSDAHRAAAIGILDSFAPVQVIEKSLGYARVVAASGEGGWMDTRTLIEGA